MRELERDVAGMQGSVLAVNRFWDMLREQLALLRVDDPGLGDGLPAALASALPVALDQRAGDQVAQIEERTALIRDVLVRIAQLAEARGGRAAPELTDVQARCEVLATEASTLRQQLAATQDALTRAQAGAEATTERLRAAERRMDRLQSTAVRAVENPLGEAQREAQEAQVAAANAEREAAERRRAAAESTDGAAAPDGRSAPDGASQEAAAAARDAAEEANALAEGRLAEIGELRAELLRATQAADEARAALQHVPEDRVMAHSTYQALGAELVFLQQEAERLRTAGAALEAENAELREFRADFQHQTAKQASTHSEELTRLLKARDADVTRLRGQRDELNAELLERRAREGVRFAQLDELKALVAPKEERIESLKGQVRRLRMHLAAQRGDEATVAQLAAEDGAAPAEDPDAALHALRQENTALREELAALRDAAERPADAEAVRAEAARLRALLAAGGEAPEDSDAARARWEAVQQELHTTRLQLTSANASTAALCDEVDRLSAAYDALEKQANAKVINLSRLEDKVLRLTTEKAKADNKYFAAMRAKDTVDAEKRALAHSAERQSKVMERYAETERSLGAQLGLAEKEISTLRSALQTHTSKLAEADRDRAVLRRKHQDAASARSAAEAAAASRTARLAEEEGARRRAEERAAALDREANKLRRKLADATAAGAAGTPERKRGGGASMETHLEYLNVRMRGGAGDTDAAVAAPLLGMQGALPRPDHPQVPAHLLRAVRAGADPDAAAQVPALWAGLCHQRCADAIL